MTTTAETDAPVRYCHGCRSFDDGPRVVAIVDQDRPDLDQLFHYDCVPEHVELDRDLVKPILAARSKGKRNGDLSKVAAAHAATLVEAPADDDKDNA